MSVPPKRRRSDDCDMISSLPDDVLVYILTFMPTKSVLRTRILSTRWKNLFASVQYLDFSDKNDHIDSNNFASSVTHVLSCVIAKLRHILRLSLECNKSYSHSLISTWISAALIYNLRDLYFSATFPVIAPFPLSLLNCTTLVDLDLKGKFELTVPGSHFVSFPRLKKLTLSGLILNDENSVHIFFDGCHVLERLEFKDCVVDDTRVKKLAVAVCSLKDFHMCDMNGDYELELVAPRLEHFYCDSYATRGYSGSISNSLCTAGLSLELHENHLQEEKVSQLINMALIYSHHPLPTFSNMTTLRISATTDAGWELFPNLLNNAPCLEKLYFNNGLVDVDGVIIQAASYLQECVLACVSSHLKEVIFNYFQGHEEEFEMVEYILKNAKVLEKITIVPSVSYHFYTGSSCPEVRMKNEFPMTKRLLTLPRCSKTCRIVFTEWWE